MADEDDVENQVTSPQIERLRKQEAELKLRADIATTRRQLAQIGLSDAKVPEGTIDVGGDTPVEGLVLAYQAINALATTLAKRIAGRTPKPERVFIHNAADFRALSALNAFGVQLELIRGRLEGLAAEAGAALGEETAELLELLPVAGAVIGSALEFASLFRVDQSFNYANIEVENQALVTAAAGELRKSQIDVIATTTTPVLGGQPPESGIRHRLGELRDLQSQLVGLRSRIARSIKTNTGGLVENGGAAPEDGGSAGVRLSGLDARIEAALTELEEFVAALVKPDDPAAGPFLAQLLEAETLHGLIDEKTCFLWLKAVASGGGSRTRKTAVSSKISYSGGAIVSFALYDRFGSMLDAATIPLYSGFIEIDEVEPRTGLLPVW